jgi:uncharacterized protein (TIGR00304 family)
MLALGIAGLTKAVSDGDAELHLVLIFPVISGSGGAFVGGSILLVVGIFMLFLSGSAAMVTRYEVLEREVAGPSERTPEEGRSSRPKGGPEFGGVVFIGPIPVVFGKGSFGGPLMLVMAIVVTILLILFFLAALF